MTPSSSFLDVAYWIDQKAIIRRVNASWNSAALLHEAPEIQEGMIVGQPLFRFISGDSTRMFMEALIQAARIRKQPVRQLYRCDSPSERREMEMLILPEPSGLLRLIHRTIRITPSQRQLRFSTQGPVTARVHRCSMCNRLGIRAQWWEPDEAPLDIDAGTLPVLYRVCPDCQQALS